MRRLCQLALAAILLFNASPAAATITFTNPGGAFAFTVDSGLGGGAVGNNPTLTMIAGVTYSIHISMSSPAFPMQFMIGSGSGPCSRQSLYSFSPTSFSSDQSQPQSGASFNFTPTWQMGGTSVRYVETIHCFSGAILVKQSATSCPAGYVVSPDQFTCLFNGTPPPTCDAGFHLVGNTCVADPPPPPPVCDPGFHAVGNTCVADPLPPPTCGSGFHLDTGTNTCVADPPPDPTLSLYPRLECVMTDIMNPGTFLVMFGYENISTAAIPVAYGAQNQVNVNGTSGAIDGEPTSFAPGIYPFAFTTRIASGQATWTLGTRSVTGDTSTPACGLQGPKGDAGLTGVAGANGLDGAAGPKGDQGDTGPMGATGAMGSQGLVGATGAVGPQGAFGLGLGFEIRRISAATTVVWPDGNRSLVYLATTSGANVVITLPPAAESVNRFITVRRADGGREVRVRPAAGDTINGATAAVAMATKDQYVTLVSDGVEWVVFAQQ